ncbi:NADH dehydrogenase subunit 5, Involved in CO2 fixation [Richelia intracellularis]|nr:NADH dehydrogenase subunit 5, Involved in CO2 fixation [Richelia intracellularis]
MQFQLIGYQRLLPMDLVLDWLLPEPIDIVCHEPEANYGLCAIF